MKDSIIRSLEIPGDHPLTEEVAQKNKRSITVSRRMIVAILILATLSIVADIAFSLTGGVWIACFLGFAATLVSLGVDMVAKQLAPLVPGQFSELVEATHDQRDTRQRFQDWLASGRTIRQRDFDQLMLDNLKEKDERLKSEMWKERVKSNHSLSQPLS